MLKAKALLPVQERAETSRVSAEAAELHSLLQTGKLERQAQIQSLEELRVENSVLLQRIAQLDAKNDDQEKMLASVLARTQGDPQAQSNGPRVEGSTRSQTNQPDGIAAAGETHLKPH